MLWVANYIPTFLRSHLAACQPNRGFDSLPLILSNFDLDTVYGERYTNKIRRDWLFCLLFFLYIFYRLLLLLFFLFGIFYYFLLFIIILFVCYYSVIILIINCMNEGISMTSHDWREIRHQRDWWRKWNRPMFVSLLLTLTLFSLKRGVYFYVSHYSLFFLLFTCLLLFCLFCFVFWI